MVRERATQHAIAVTVEVADDVGTIEADELRFKQVVLNLLSNAVKFTPDGGSVSVRAYREGTELMVTVTDTGIGVPAGGPGADLRVLPAGPPGRTERGGHRPWSDAVAGASSSCSAGECGWRALSASEARSASRFRECGAGHEAGSTGATTSRCPSRRRRPGVAGSRLGLSGRFTDPGAAGQGRRRGPRVGAQGAAGRRGTRDPAAGLDGWQVLAELKADPATADIPVVIAIGVDDRSRGLALGADAYLRKPMRRDELIDALRRMVSVDRVGTAPRSRHDGAPHPRGRGQSVESQAGSRRTEVRRLRRHRGAVRGGGSARRPGGSTGSGADGSPTPRYRRNGDAAQVAAGHARPHVPVVAVTALAMAEDKDRASRAGFDGYVEKPISVRALPGQIEAFLGGRAD